MQTFIRKRAGVFAAAIALTFVTGSTVLALPPQASVHAQAAGPTSSTNQAVQARANGQAHLAAAQLRACQNREKAINSIMSRIDTRAKNQITLFGTIATRVENFYTQKGKTVSNYDQLVAAVNTAKDKANTDFATMQSGSNFTCSANDPKGMVTTFQTYLKTEISDLQNYRTAVKNLIVGVAKAQGTTLSDTNPSASQGGQQ